MRRYLLTLIAAGLLFGCGGNDTYSPALVSGGGLAPSFRLAVAPASVTVTEGQTATYTVTVTALNGFSGVVGLSVSGLPAGATAVFSPASVTPTAQGVTSTLTITTTAGGTGNLSGTIKSVQLTRPTATRAAMGRANFPLTITGTSGNLTSSATAQLVVSPASAPSFTITAGGSQTVQAGQAASYNFTVTSVNGFAGTVGFSMTSLPGGAVATFTPTSVNLTANGTANASVTIQTSASTPAGTTTPTIVGTSGTLTNQAAETLIVTASGGGNPLVNPFRVAIHPKGQYAYVTTNMGLGFNSQGSVAQFRVNADGTLTPLNPATVAAGASMSDVRVDNSGRYLYATSGGSLGVFQYSINQADGTLTPLNPPRVPTTGAATAVLFLPDGTHAYVADGDGRIRVGQIGADGTLTYVGSDLASGVPKSLAMDPLGKYLYAAGQGDMRQWRIEPTGLLTRLGDVPPSMGGIVVNPTGTNLYGAGHANINGTVAFQFAIQSDGTVTPLNPPSVAAGQATTGAAINKTGTTLYVTDYIDGSGPGKVWQFRVTANGTLSPLSPANVATGVGPASATVSPSGDFLYVANALGGNISIFRINADGTLTPIQ